MPGTRSATRLSQTLAAARAHRGCDTPESGRVVERLRGRGSASASTSTSSDRPLHQPTQSGQLALEQTGARYDDACGGTVTKDSSVGGGPYRQTATAIHGEIQ